ncbi:MAG: hypothetical protein RLY93_07300 [Sumerlaeia bacterium]
MLLQASIIGILLPILVPIVQDDNQIVGFSQQGAFSYLLRGNGGVTRVDLANGDSSNFIEWLGDFSNATRIASLWVSDDYVVGQSDENLYVWDIHKKELSHPNYFGDFVGFCNHGLLFNIAGIASMCEDFSGEHCDKLNISTTNVYSRWDASGDVLAVSTYDYGTTAALLSATHSYPSYYSDTKLLAVANDVIALRRKLPNETVFYYVSVNQAKRDHRVGPIAFLRLDQRITADHLILSPDAKYYAMLYWDLLAVGTLTASDEMAQSVVIDGLSHMSTLVGLLKHGDWLHLAYVDYEDNIKFMRIRLKDKPVDGDVK